jgi:PAS domain S-box-containing protein
MSGPNSPSAPASLDDRILILAPTANDARLTAGFFVEAGMSTAVCSDIAELCEEIGRGCAALLLAEETLRPSAKSLLELLAEQPVGGGIPIIIITSSGEVSQLRMQRTGVFGTAGNVTLLERPFHPMTLLSVAEGALAARRRQREVGGLLRELKAGEERLLEILNSISDAFLAVDRDWRITYVNAGYVKLVSPLFRSVDELLGGNLWALFPDLVGTEMEAFYRRVMSEQRSDTLELFYEPLQAWLDVRAHPAPGTLSIYIQDISARKRRDGELQALTRRVTEQAEIFDQILSNIPDLAYSFDREARVIYANRPLLDIWGKSSLDEVVGKNLHDLGYPEDLERMLHAQLLEVVATGRAISGETNFTSASGKADIHEYVYSPVFGADGSVVAVAGITRLVTQRRKDEKTMRHHAAIVEWSDDAIISKDLDGVITSWNAGAERLFGYSAEEAIGKPMLLIIPVDRHGEEPVILDRIRRGHTIDHYETIRRRKDGSLVEVSLSVSPMKDHTGRVIGASKIARDITQQKKSEAALKEAKEAAESANRAKDHFLAVLSHELRTPLTPVLMIAAALEKDPAVPPELRADMATIRRNVELETKLIDDLLDLSRITTGKLALQQQPVDLNQSVREVCGICESQIAEKGVRLEMDFQDDVGYVRADPARLQQVLWNVLKNATKFTPSGGSIHVSTGRASDRRVRIAVRDTGVGIAPAILPKIFDAFEQGGDPVTRQFGGLGLGLAITRALVELHDGRISVHSEGAGKGSVFTIEWPTTVAQPDAGDAEHRHLPGAEALRILVVEDHADTSRMLARLLGSAGYEVTVANSAEDGLAAAEARAFDLVISDIGLPRATGYDFMRRFRERHSTPSIAMSGYGMEEDVRRSFEAGFDEHIIKPVNPSLLNQAIRRLSADR